MSGKKIPLVGDELSKGLVQRLCKVGQAHIACMPQLGIIGKTRCDVGHVRRNYDVLKAILECTPTVAPSVLAAAMQMAGEALKLADVEYELHGHYAHRCVRPIYQGKATVKTTDVPSQQAETNQASANSINRATTTHKQLINLG